MKTSIIQWLRNNVLYIAFAQALIATLGSLYFSEVRNFTPCVLCWYQRIAMYPLVVLLAVGILDNDQRVWKYVLPVAISGWIVSLYHNLLYYGIIPETAATCKAGVSCTTQFFAWFGFVTIPLLAFVAFSVIIGSMLAYRRFQHD